ncbi:MAG: AIPR family protein [Clostridium sp.]
MKYEVLVNILDKIREEAPKELKRYKPQEKEVEKIDQARSRAYIHLYLKVKFGILDFKGREELITDEQFDGGIDAYYIDKEDRVIYLIQSKFRTNEKNFENKSLTADDLINMEIDRIIKGELIDSRGNKYNSKINMLQSRIVEINDIARYEYKVIILGNVSKYSDDVKKQIIGGYNFEVFDFDRTYDELVYPMCTSTYYSEKDIVIKIDIDEKSIEELSETIVTSFGECEVSIVFVPLESIGKAVHKYKNSILKYNPRNYLSLSKNKVNETIKESVVDSEHNDFAILNNGITILCEEYSSTNKTGKKNKSQIIIEKPQFINGGQTAYTLSKIYNDEIRREKLSGKKVMLKLITISSEEGNEEKYNKFIQRISDSTNMQTKVEEADRRANDPLQVKIQKDIYSRYGYFYERKKRRV